ncbi:YhfX family PLP-dependent enzyme [Metabacillus arenae]|uniref:YhfX family PLP-dependent enzyme n=1 Tax=Metabacillus arenae TaxID=2771434 RepID=A0A926RZK7_9BACI|nr:YhfX family PLP-dependent enzyme [Metabacillus arenae]MBD1382910.1 YhfX family PLP-dependent enzyme [Metabacillus arenae]
MFLDITLRRNPELIQTAVKLHQDGTIPPNTYVIDLDSLSENVRVLKKTSIEHGMKLYYMTKQIGRSGFVGKVIEQNGIEQAVAVDIDEAAKLRGDGCSIGNFGHLVQPGKNQWDLVLKRLKPEIVTLFSYERARQLSDAALRLGLKQDVILRVINSKGFVYPGQNGGFQIDDLENSVKEIVLLPGLNVIGITSFPIMQLNEEKNDYDFTSNFYTLLKARNVLENLGINVIHLNAPGSTSCHTIPRLKDYGVTHGEPGHALTGTTPLHAYMENLKEKPSILYISEISHLDKNHAYTIAGGFYVRSNMEKALYGRTETVILENSTEVDKSNSENIDYYGSLKRQSDMTIGDSVVYAFRTQIFVTRAHVAFIRKIDSKAPEIVYFQKRGG